MRLLFHACCAPCILYPQSVLTSKKIDVTYFFFNPNIHPEKEYIRRRETIKKYCKDNDISLIVKDPAGSSEEREKKWLEAKAGSRCTMCYDIRLEETARYASLNGFDYFSTTLLGSIYQDHDKIISLAGKYEKEYGIRFYYLDFREGFRIGQQMAREADIYRQKYCGCICSLNSSKFREKVLKSLGEYDPEIL